MEEWSCFWTKISDECPKSHLEGSGTLWIKLEEAMNSMNKSLLLSVEPVLCPESLRFVLDDDKVHCNGKK